MTRTLYQLKNYVKIICDGNLDEMLKSAGSVHEVSAVARMKNFMRLSCICWNFEIW
jgi:hypothetical protein